MADGKFFGDLYKTAAVENWKGLEISFKVPNRSFRDFSKPNTYANTNKTILHYACAYVNKRDAEEAVNFILTKMDTLDHTTEEFEAFLNYKDRWNEAALDTAIRLGRDNIIVMLVQKGANFPIRFTPQITGTYFKCLLKHFDNGIRLHRDINDESNEYLWTIFCNFGKLKDNNLGEAELLANVLDLPRPRRRAILMHPLVQLFVHAMWHNYKRLIWIAIFLNLLWYLMASKFLVGCMTKLKRPTNSNTAATDQNDSFPYFNVLYYLLLAMFYIVFLYTKYTEMRNTPSKKYSFRQTQNWGQITVFVVVALAALIRFILFISGHQFEDMASWFQFILSFLYTIGLLASLLLVQGLFTRIEGIGVFNQMMIKSFKQLMKFMSAFAALLIAYAIIFSALLPNDITSSLNWKNMYLGFTNVLAKMNGELNFKDVFTRENIDQISFVIPAVIVYFSFIVVAMILLLNLLVGLAVTDTEKSRQKAQAAHVASCLEAVYLMETFIWDVNTQQVLRKLRLWDRITRNLSLESHASTTENACLLPTESRNEFSFVKIPKQIRKEMYKISRIFQNGIAENEDSDLSE